MNTAEKQIDLSEGQQQALMALLKSSSVAEAARECGITPATIFKYLSEENFRKQYRQARRDSLEVVTRRIENAACEAVDVLLEVMTDKENSASQRIMAAGKILDAAYRIHETDVMERLEALEARR